MAGRMNRRAFVFSSLSLPLQRLVPAEPMGMMEVTSSETRADRAIMWRRTTDNLSLEQARWGWTATGPHIAGMVLAAHDGIPLRVEYRIDCDEGWQTRRVQICQCFAGAHKSLCLDHEQDGRWRTNGQFNETLEGCTDVDLGITPSTNTLPIRRLAMRIGAVSEVQAAWVRFPELNVSRAHQSYECFSAQKYIYRNLDSGFTAPVTIDSDGLVREYGGVWTRVAEGPAAPDLHSFSNALISPGPSPELANVADAMGWLIGGWSAEVRDFDRDGRVRSGAGEWWFSWVLEGRAIQDVWIVPPRAQRSDTGGNRRRSGTPSDRYGATVRWFDRQSGQWRVVWVNPVSGAVNRLAGRRDGDRIVLEGEEDGHPIRWSFNDIRPNSFIWLGESLEKNGSWRLEAEFRLKRIA
jgi:hypothetical protein